MYASDPPMTERDVVLRERQAFADGAVCWVSECRERTHSYPPRKTVTLDEITADAARKFPLPKVTQPRVVEDTHGISWRFVEERLEFRTIENWYPMLGAKSAPDGRYGIALLPTPERIKLWADLLAQPTETVDA